MIRILPTGGISSELMGKYSGKGLFEGYASQVGAALKQDVKFKSDN
jgi:hypothetical protein